MKLLKEHRFKGEELLVFWSHKDHKQSKKPKEKKDDWTSYQKAAPFGLSDSTKLTALLKTTNQTTPNSNTNTTTTNNNSKTIEKITQNENENANTKTNSNNQVAKVEVKNDIKQTKAESKEPPKAAKEALPAIASKKDTKPVDHFSAPKVIEVKQSNKPDQKQQPNATNKKTNAPVVNTQSQQQQQSTLKSDNKPTEPAPKTVQQNTNDSINPGANIFPTTETQPSFIRSSNKITFYPVQTNKIYPQLTNSFSSVNSVPSDNYDKINRQNSLSPVQDASKLDFNDVKRPSSSVKHNPDAYLKRDVYPKFPQVQNNDNKNGDSESESSSVLFKTRTSPDGDESKDKDHKL